MNTHTHSGTNADVHTLAHTYFGIAYNEKVSAQTNSTFENPTFCASDSKYQIWQTQHEWHIHAPRDHLSTYMNEPIFMYNHNLKPNKFLTYLPVAYLHYCLRLLTSAYQKYVIPHFRPS